MRTVRKTEVQTGDSGLEQNRKVLLPVGQRFTLRPHQQLYPVYGKEFSGNISLWAFRSFKTVQDSL
jgi:hypothetical protein